jgi:hypothetical protein
MPCTALSNSTLRTILYTQTILQNPCYFYSLTGTSCWQLSTLTQFMSVKRRNMLHLTAKSTQFGKKTLTSWLVEAAGTVPIQRRKDFDEGVANNDSSLAKLTQVCGLVDHSEIFLKVLFFVDIGEGWCCVPFSRGRK